ncbi:MAG TPA: EAL domain-containing protein [Acidocella sp.]|nr:EAL domain-containing protein [Acidocella sp.]
MKAPSFELAASLRLRYQPIIRLEDRKLCHVEVLARTLGEDGHLLGPQGIVEAMGNPEVALSLTRAIGERALLEYQEQGLTAHQLPLAFNLPLNVLVYPGIPQRIEALRKRHGLPAGLLRFELTETQPVQNLPLAQDCIAALRDAGYLLALDDIVPGTPFLMALMNTPIGAVKLDRSVVTDDSPAAQDFIHKVARLAAANRQDVVAEGIETDEQLHRMRGHGVTHGQGFLFSRPLGAEQLATWLPAG